MVFQKEYRIEVAQGKYLVAVDSHGLDLSDLLSNVHLTVVDTEFEETTHRDGSPWEITDLSFVLQKKIQNEMSEALRYSAELRAEDAKERL